MFLEIKNDFNFFARQPLRFLMHKLHQMYSWAVINVRRFFTDRFVTCLFYHGLKANIHVPLTGWELGHRDGRVKMPACVLHVMTLLSNTSA
jgi:hypothetical protein